MEYWLTDVATNHQVTNQQPNDDKEPINKSEEKVRSQGVLFRGFWEKESDGYKLQKL